MWRKTTTKIKTSKIDVGRVPNPQAAKAATSMRCEYVYHTFDIIYDRSISLSDEILNIKSTYLYICVCSCDHMNVIFTDTIYMVHINHEWQNLCIYNLSIFLLVNLLIRFLLFLLRKLLLAIVRGRIHFKKWWAGWVH